MTTGSEHDPRPFTVEQFPEQPEIWWRETARMFCTNKAAVAGAASLVFIVLVGAFGPIIMAADPFAIIGAPLREPGDGTLLGTDYLGRDVFTGIIYGVRTTLAIAITATIFAVFVGITIGAVAGFYGGKIDNALMRVTEFFQVLPPLVFAMVIVAVFSHDLWTVIIAIGITTWTTEARLTRAEFLKIKEREYVTAEARGRRDRPAHDAAGDPSQCAAPAHHRGDAQGRHLRHLRSGAELSRADGSGRHDLGQDDRTVPGLLLRGLVDGDLPGRRHPGDGPVHRADRRRVERCLQSEAAWALTRRPCRFVPVAPARLPGVGGTTCSLVASRRPARREAASNDVVLRVENLCVDFGVKGRQVRILSDISFSLRRGETLGIIGESGCGKSMTALALLRMVPSPPGRITAGRVLLNGEDLVQVSEKRIRGIRGGAISMIFQEPMTSLNPVYTIGNQIAETIRRHKQVDRAAAWREAVDLLDMVHIPAPERRVREYPHQLSGGMRQRVMIAMALACEPTVLLADEPTTALDVTVQAQIFDLLKEIQDTRGTCIVLITHDFGAVSEMADRVLVMYAGHKVEEGTLDEISDDARHPYTRGLLRSMPEIVDDPAEVRVRLPEIPGSVPDLLRGLEGCPFAPRCPSAMSRCRELPGYSRLGDHRSVKCWLESEGAGGRGGS